MISAKPTANLTGITIEGDYDDFSQLVDSIHRITGMEEDYKDFYWGVKNRLLGICYDIRHAYMGDRDIKLVDNGVHDEMMKWHSKVLPRAEVHFAVDVLFPEAVFVALSVPEIYGWSRYEYGQRSKKQEEMATVPAHKYAYYHKDRAVVDTLSAVILEALADCIGDSELEKIIRFKERQYGAVFMNYSTQYVDKCNVEYLKTAPDKRRDKLKNIAKRFIQKPSGYSTMRSELEYAARVHGCSIHELHDPELEYPEEIEW